MKIKGLSRRAVSLLLSLMLVLGMFTIIPFTASALDAVSYIDASGGEHTVTDYSVFDESSYDISGWVVVKNNCTISSRVDVEEDTDLILCNDATLNAVEGITVKEGKTLTIWQQAPEQGKETGVLIANSGTSSDDAGIGSKIYAGGSLIVNGGNITAYGGRESAGIGASGSSKATFGSITINAGTVNAYGGERAAGIGCSALSGYESITINGGTVTATGGEKAAGIGGGNSKSGGDVTVNGGTVSATGGTDAAGIGGGYTSPGINIIINDGTVTATGSQRGAGIGGGYKSSGGSVTINSGTVTAIGGPETSTETGNGGAGIGSGDYGGSWTVTIFDGNITASGGKYAAGIGGANSGSGDIIILKGGTINATGGYQAAGIGGGKSSKGVETTIDDGTIEAYGGYRGAGVGSGSSSKAGSVTVNGGSITAVGGDGAPGIGSAISSGGKFVVTVNDGVINASGGTNGPGIGGSFSDTESTITISGGDVTAVGDGKGAGIGGTSSNSGGTVIISAGTVSATGGSSGAGIGGGYNSAGGVITVSGGQVTAAGGEKAAGIGAGEKGTEAEITLGWTEESDYIDSTGYIGTVIFAEGKQFYYGGSSVLADPDNLTGGRLIPYLSNKYIINIENAANGSVMPDRPNAYQDELVTLTANSEYPYLLSDISVSAGSDSVEVTRVNACTYTFVMPDEAVTVTPEFSVISYTIKTSEGNKTCYPIVGHVTEYDSSINEWYAVTEDIVFSERVNITGDVKLYLCEGMTLNCMKGIHLAEGNSLTIEGKGALIADASSGDGYGAGIGGNRRENCGSVHIKSGTVTAACSENGAAIGGGDFGSGGNITISGGKVTATGSDLCAGIGGGDKGSGGIITITGGTVTAYGGDYSSGIGGGYGAYGGTITITGGRVKATGGIYSTGIGGGRNNGADAIVLGWTHNSDFIEASGYKGPVSFAEGKSFLRFDNYSLATTDNIGGVRIIPRIGEPCGVSVNSTGDGVITADVQETVMGQTVNLHWTTSDRYILLSSLTVMDSADHEVTVEYSDNYNAYFTMPDSSVTVNASFAQAETIRVTTTQGVKECMPITQKLNFDTYSTGWYAVTEDTEISARVGISGDVGIYLCEGVTLRCTKGIEVGENNNLTFEGSGTLDSGNDESGTSMGAGNQLATGGNITINGGSIYAYGGYCGSGICGALVEINGGKVNASGGGLGAGIGNPDFNQGCVAVINGGEVTATGGDGQSGFNCAGVTINGGKVTAYGGGGGAGIGYGDVTINGGEVNAYGCGNGAGIGSRFQFDCGTIRINGGKVYATGYTGIGRGKYGSGGTVVLDWTRAGDYIYASGYDVDSVSFAADKYFKIKGTNELATPDNISGNTIVPSDASLYGITASPAENSRIDSIYIEGYDENGILEEAPNGSVVLVRCSMLPNYSYNYEVTGLIVTAQGGGNIAVTKCGDNLYSFTMPARKVTLTTQIAAITYYEFKCYYDDHAHVDSIRLNSADGQKLTRKEAREGAVLFVTSAVICPYEPCGLSVATYGGLGVDVTQVDQVTYSFVMPAEGVTIFPLTRETAPVSRHTTEGEKQCVELKPYVTEWIPDAYDGWYTATGNVTINGPVKVKGGDVKLFLTQNTTLSCSGIIVDSNATLTIEGEGTLIADRSGTDLTQEELLYRTNFSAGIDTGGGLTVRSGNIIATGGEWGAGIGSSGMNYGSEPEEGLYNGVTILGGNVTATAGKWAAGIGGTVHRNCGTITIAGGNVTAKGGLCGAGIGSGMGTRSDDIFIIGGTVNANGGVDSAGIGCGDSGKCGNITISGGIINANGKDGAGIGDGRYAKSGKGVIAINGGQITAYGGFGCAGIGGGRGRAENVENTIVLGWTSPDDFIKSSSYDGDVSFAEGKVFLLYGTDTIATVDNIDNERIVPKPGLGFFAGEGTESKPYQIKSAEDWITLGDYIAEGGATSGMYFRLMNDITVSTNIGTGSHVFAGVFDGNGKKMTLALSGGYYMAPFYSIGGAAIRNMTVDGSVSGGKHCSALVGVCYGGPNLIENVVVTASVTGSTAYAGGLLGHGKTYATTMKDCVFTGSLSVTGANDSGTIYGWCDVGATPVLINCLDVSDNNKPIGRGNGTVTVTNCYHTAAKMTGGHNPWSDGGKLAYNVIGDGVGLTLGGNTGIAWNGNIYAGEGDSISLTASGANVHYTVCGGGLVQNGAALTVTMPAANVTVAVSDKPIIRGDADGDGDVTILDASDIQRCLADYSVRSLYFDTACVTDDALSINDATAIQRYLADYADPYHIGEVVG